MPLRINLAVNLSILLSECGLCTIFIDYGENPTGEHGNPQFEIGPSAELRVELRHLQANSALSTAKLRSFTDEIRREND